MNSIPLPIAIAGAGGAMLVLAGIGVAIAQHMIGRERERECVRCGCTEDRACDGGCWWWSKNPWICSRCAFEADDWLAA